MIQLFSKRYHPPGTAPGTLKRPQEAPAEAARIYLLSYDRERVLCEHEIEAEELPGALAADAINWVHVEGFCTPEQIALLGQRLALHALALEDVMNLGQRPKVDFYDDCIFTILSVPKWDREDIQIDQLSMFLRERLVVSFHAGQPEIFEPIRRRLREQSRGIRANGADYLLYTLIDLVTDQAFPVLESFGEAIEDLEEELLRSPDRSTLSRIHAAKRELLLLRRQLWPSRDVLNQLIRSGTDLIDESVQPFLHDVYDHTVHIMDLLESYRDMTASMLDVYLSSVSNRLNDVMRVLTIISTLFIPLTFLTGVYGMNFGNNTASPWAMPELHWYYGYPMLWLVMIGVAIGMLVYFKRKGWL